MTITKDWLKSCESPESGGYTSAQFEVLRVAGLSGAVYLDGRTQAGWKDRIVGREIPDDLAAKFFEYRTVYKAKTANRKAKEQGEGNLSLF